MKHLISLIVLMCAALMGSAQDSLTIADRINASGKATVTQPEELNARLARHAGIDDAPAAEAAAPAGGYRIQVFSGNNAATAKRDAESRAAAIRDRFPELATYVIYDAPYWRLRVGDFPSSDHAGTVLGEMKRAFPSFAREMRLVRDRINVK